MSAFRFPLGVPVELSSDTAFLNLGTQTEGFAARPLEAFAPAQAGALHACYCNYAALLPPALPACTLRLALQLKFRAALFPRAKTKMHYQVH